MPVPRPTPGRRWLLAVGFQQPRLPWSYPTAAAARLSPLSAQPIAAHRAAPADRKQLEWFRPTEIDVYSDIDVRPASWAAPLPSDHHRLSPVLYK